MDKPSKSIEEIILQDGRYSLEAVQFVRAGLNFGIQQMHSVESPSLRRHIGGQQLCMGLRELARQKWGMMARSVLNCWNVYSTRDFGEIIFLLVESGWMQKQPSDCIDDFDDVFDFEVELAGDFNLD